jgi:hypothetical protein
MTDSYGVFLYDVPTGNGRLYHRLRSRIRGIALRINLSCYLIQWGQRQRVLEIVEEAKKVTGQYAAVSLLKFDNSDEKEIQRVAKESLTREINLIAERMQKRIAEVRKKERVLSEACVKRVEQQLKDAESLAIVFGLTEDLSYVLETAKKTFDADLTVLSASRGVA